MGDMFIKRINAFLLAVCILALSACGVIPQISQQKENGTENETEAQMSLLTYSNASISFEYPAEWIIEEKIGEDGTAVSFTDPETGNTEIFLMEQGEAWRVNLENDKEEYKKLYGDSYENMDIKELKQVTIDTCQANKLVFSYTNEQVEYTVTKYMVISGLVSFEFTFSYPVGTEKKYEDKIGSILSSVRFEQLKINAE